LIALNQCGIDEVLERMYLFVNGIIIGFSIAAPVGPIGILCIRRTFNQGKRFGLISGLGAATADAVYGGVAAFGLSFLSSFLVDQHLWIQLLGGLFLCYLGFTSARSTSPVESGQNPNAKGLFWAYITTFLLTITNPLTILSFVAIFTSLGYVQESGDKSALILIVGIFLGSACWWLFLSSFIGFFRHMISKRSILWINIGSGLVLILYGVYSISRLFIVY
jgi:threonine/homoserine/homoserine lactone efflux protein